MTEHFDTQLPENPWDPEYDAVVAAPGSHRVVYEDDSCRIMEVELEPGGIEPLHHHAGESIMVVFAATAIRIYDHLSRQIIDVPPREASEEHPIIQDIPPEGLHQIENRDPIQTYEAVRLEYK